MAGEEARRNRVRGMAVFPHLRTRENEPHRPPAHLKHQQGGCTTNETSVLTVKVHRTTPRVSENERVTTRRRSARSF